jgi:hypothetical protein
MLFSIHSGNSSYFFPNDGKFVIVSLLVQSRSAKLIRILKNELGRELFPVGFISWNYQILFHRLSFIKWRVFLDEN